MAVGGWVTGPAEPLSFFGLPRSLRDIDRTGIHGLRLLPPSTEYDFAVVRGQRKCLLA